MKPRRTLIAAVALILPALVVGAVALFLRLREPAEPCAEIDEPLGDPATGPRGWVARGRYEQWPEGGVCRAAIGISFFAPGESWEAEAWSPAAHVTVSAAHLPEASRRRGWLSWGSDGEPVLFGLGNVATPVHVDALPDVHEGGRFRRCPTIRTARPNGSDGPPAAQEINAQCEVLPADL